MNTNLKNENQWQDEIIQIIRLLNRTETSEKKPPQMRRSLVFKIISKAI